MPTAKELLAKQHWGALAAILATGSAGALFAFHAIPVIALVVVVVVSLLPTAYLALEELWQKHKIGTELFITIAVIVSLVGGEYLAGAVVLMIILIAEYIASVSNERVRASISTLVDAVPKVATVVRDGAHVTVALSEILPGEVVLVRAGEKIPVDGTVRGGSGAVDQSPITGESLPQEKNLGDEVFAGTILEVGALDITVTHLAEDTVFARIIALVAEAEANEPNIQQFTDKVAAWLVPVVFVMVLMVYLYTRDISLVIALLIFTSPAELGLATPLVTISAVIRAAREGILVKGGLFLETLAQADIFVFDKTGTLTLGAWEVDEIGLDAEDITETELLTLAAAADRRSAHPLAQAIVACAEERRVPMVEPESFEVLASRGVRAVIDGRDVVVGNEALFAEQGVVVPDGGHMGETDTVVYVAVDGVIKGHFHLVGTTRPNAAEAIENLRAAGVSRILMLTGDHAEAAKRIAEELSIDEVEADLMPEDKIKIVRRLQTEGHVVAMVGDGINDAPSLVAADIGVAMGAVGTESAMEAADIVLVNDDLHKLAEARTLSRRAYRTIKENIIVGVGVVHVVGIILVLLRVIGPVEAAIIHLVPDTLVFLNSTKLLRVKL